MRLVLSGPAGVMLDKSVEVEKNQAQLFKAVGKRLTKKKWPAGNYSGSVSLIRNGRIINTKKLQSRYDRNLLFSKFQFDTAVLRSSFYRIIQIDGLILTKAICRQSTWWNGQEVRHVFHN